MILWINFSTTVDTRKNEIEKTGLYQSVFLSLCPFISSASSHQSPTPVSLAVTSSSPSRDLSSHTSQSNQTGLSGLRWSVVRRAWICVCLWCVSIINCPSHWTEKSVSLHSVHLSDNGKANTRKKVRNTLRGKEAWEEWWIIKRSNFRLRVFPFFFSDCKKVKLLQIGVMWPTRICCDRLTVVELSWRNIVYIIIYCNENKQFCIIKGTQSFHHEWVLQTMKKKSLWRVLNHKCLLGSLLVLFV